MSCTSSSVTDLYNRLERLLSQHFDDHQRYGETGTKSFSVPSRVAKIQKECEALSLQRGMQGLHLNERDEDEGNDEASLSSSSNVNDSSPSTEQEQEHHIADILVKFMDCAIATELTVDSRESVERILELSAAVACNFCIRSGNKNIIESVLIRAVQFSKVLLERVRSEACQWLGYFAKYWTFYCRSSGPRQDNSNEQDHGHSNDDAMLAMEKLLDQAAKELLPRLTDKSLMVRQAAIIACPHFFTAFEHPKQELSEAVDNLLQALLWNLQHDPSVTNRVEACFSIPVQPITLDYLLGRVRDVKSKVRVAALTVITEKVSVLEDLQPEECAALVRTGLTDRCVDTKEAASKMICVGWIKSVKYDPVSLLQKMNPTLHEDECEKVVDLLLEAYDDQGNSLLEALSQPEIRAFRQGIDDACQAIDREDQDLDVEPVFFARVVCQRAFHSQTMTSAQKEAITSKILPDIPVLCQVFERHAVMLIKAIDDDRADLIDRLTTTCLQILHLTKTTMEEGSRRHLAAVMKRVLGSVTTPEDLVEGCLNCLLAVYDRESDLLAAVEAVLTDLSRDSGDNPGDEGLQTIRVLRILSVLTITLEKASTQIASHPAVTNFSKHVIPAVSHSNELIREAGIATFGRLGLFTNKETLLSEYKQLMLKIAANDEEKMEIRAQAVLALSDWSMLFPETLEPCNGDASSPSKVSLTDIVTDMMEHPTLVSVVCVGAEVALKLLYGNVVCNAQWLAKLVSIFFDERMAEEDCDTDIREIGNPIRLQQRLSLFFPAYCVKSRAGRNALVASIGPLLSLVLLKKKIPTNKKNKSRKAPPIVKMIDYVCSNIDTGKEEAAAIANQVGKEEAEDMATPKKNGQKKKSCQDMSSASLLVAIQIANFLSHDHQDIGTTVLRALCKIIGGTAVNLDHDSPKNLSILKQVMEELGMEITDDKSLASLAKLNEVLADVEDCVEEEEDGVDKDDQASLAKSFENAVHISNDKENMNGKNDYLGDEVHKGAATTGRDSLASASSFGSRRTKLWGQGGTPDGDHVATKTGRDSMASTSSAGSRRSLRLQKK